MGNNEVTEFKGLLSMPENALPKIFYPPIHLVNPDAQQFLQEVKHSINTGTQIVVLDFQKVTFVDSSGLTTLVTLQKMSKANGTKLLLCSLNSQITNLLQITSTDRLFQILANVKEVEAVLQTSEF